MRDNLRRSRAIRAALTQGYPGGPTGHVARHFSTLAARISGLVAGKSTQRPTLATRVPDGQQPESRVKRFTRWLRHERISEAGYFIPSAEVLLERLAFETLVLVIAGSVGGRGGIALMIHVVDTGRALPLCWLVRQGKQGHFADDLQSALVEQAQEVVPLGASVVWLGEGECDGIGLPRTIEEAGWSDVWRTGWNLTASWDGETCRLETLGWCIKPGPLVDLPEVCFPAEAYGPMRLLCCWAKGAKEPLDLVTTMTSAAEACRL